MHWMVSKRRQRSFPGGIKLSSSAKVLERRGAVCHCCLVLDMKPIWTDVIVKAFQ